MNTTNQPQSSLNFLLRRWQKGDEQYLSKNANNKLISDNLRDSFPNPYTLEDAEHWIAMTSHEFPIFNFCIEIDGKAAGGIGIVLKTDIYRKNAEIGYWLGEDYWGKGIMSAAVKQVTDYAFQNFDIARIYAGIFEYNLASQKVLKKAGYIQEAILKKSLFKNGQLFDEIIWSTWKEGINK